MTDYAKYIKSIENIKDKIKQYEQANGQKINKPYPAPTYAEYKRLMANGELGKYMHDDFGFDLPKYHPQIILASLYAERFELESYTEDIQRKIFAPIETLCPRIKFDRGNNIISKEQKLEETLKQCLSRRNIISRLPIIRTFTETAVIKSLTQGQPIGIPAKFLERASFLRTRV